MRSRSRPFTYLVALALASTAFAQKTTRPSHSCLGAEERARIAAALTAYEVMHGPMSSAPEGAASATSLVYRFYPHGGNLRSDLQPSALVDLDPTPGILSFDCSDWSYDGHSGLDSEIRGFEAMDVGVPVL